MMVRWFHGRMRSRARDPMSSTWLSTTYGSTAMLPIRTMYGTYISFSIRSTFKIDTIFKVKMQKKFTRSKYLNTVAEFMGHSYTMSTGPPPL